MSRPPRFAPPASFGVSSLLPILAAGLLLPAAARAGEIGFAETFALAEDREKALEELVPGTEDFFYYRCLHLLATERPAACDPLLADWVRAHGETPRVWEIRSRRALATYDADPKATIEYLVRRLGVGFGHERVVPGAEPQLPTALDPALIAPQAWTDRARAHSPDTIDAWEDGALRRIAAGAEPGAPLDRVRRRQLLSRLVRPDIPGLAKLVADDLREPDAGGFGSIGIHRLLTLEQLRELLELEPRLRDDATMVAATLARLQPTADEDPRDPAVLRAYLGRLEAYARGLGPVHNSLKALVLHQRLSLDRREGRFDKQAFLDYLALPRPQGYVSPKLLSTDAARAFPCNLGQAYEGCLLPPVGDDEPLVRAYLGRFLVDAADTKEFEPFLEKGWLDRLFAETKLLAGLGAPDKHAAILGPAAYRALRDRVDIEILPSNPHTFAPDAPVALEVAVKNVPELTVRIFEIDTLGHYRTTLAEVDTDIPLDGLEPTAETVLRSADDALRRTVRRVELPQLSRPGIYVVDFVGNGRSSRALVRKGRLRPLVVATASGQRFTILDDAGRKVRGARLWIEGREYAAGDDGTVVVPPSTAPGRRPLVVTAPIALADGTTAEISSLDTFDHEGETLALSAGIHVDRESLRTRRTAEVVVRPALLANGRPVSIAAIEEPRLTIRSVDLDGVPAVREIAPFPLFEDRESIHEFLVPQRLAEVTFVLSGKVKRLAAGGEKADLAASRTFTLNQIDRTDKVEDLFLVRSADRWLLEVRGKSGEPRPSRPVGVTLKARDVRHPFTVQLKTDVQGAIDLGPLEGIESVSAQGPEGTAHAWTLAPDRTTLPQSAHGRTGEALRLPYLPLAIHRTGRPAGKPDRADASLFELRGGAYAADRFANLDVDGGSLVLRDLPPGDYELFLPAQAARVEVRISAGTPIDGFLVGPFRQLEAPRLEPTAIERVAPEGDDLVIRLTRPNAFTRVHVFPSRMTPDFDPFAALAVVRGPEPWAFARGAFASAYVSGRNLGDEIAYVLRRRAQAPFAGAMLARPSLLLHPWATEDTSTAKQDPRAGEEFDAVADAPMSMAKAAAPAPASPAQGPASFADLDFLADDPPVATNLAPGDDGTIRLPLSALAGHQELTVVVVDPTLTLARGVALAAAPPRLADQRLLRGLDPAAHLIQRQKVSLVDPAVGPFVIEDAASGRFEAYDSLARVFGLFTAVSRHPDLPTFAFLLRWPSLDEAEKKRLYSEHACHELHVFLFHKDKPFFEAVVLPGLRTKKDRTFIDHWLLGDDLSPWLEPWRYGQLNVAERALLARRLADERPRTARHIEDRLAVLPPDTERRRQLFEAAVAAGALDAADRFGTVALGDELAREQGQLGFGLAERPANGPMGRARAAGSFAGGGMGGMGGGMPGGVPAEPPPAPPAAARESLDAAPADKDIAAGRSLRRRDEARQSVADRFKRKAEEKSVDRFADAKEAEELGVDMEGRKSTPFFAERGGEAAALFRVLEPTKEWAESNYRRLRIAVQDAALIGPGRFWLDYAKADPALPFRSVHLADATRNFPEMMLALAVLDLPFESPEHATAFEGGRMTLTPAGPFVAFHEETVAAEPPAAPSSVLVSQNFLRQSERQEIVDGEPRDKFVAGEFLTHVVYTAQVVVTNPTSSRRKVSVLLQIPRGSVPVLGGKATRSVPLVLEPYAVQALEYSFEFPAAGEFAHYPVHVSQGDDLVAFVPPVTFTVVDRPARPDEQSWEAVSQDGTDEQVLAWLDGHTLENVNLDLVAWRMKDAGMFRRVTARLAERHVWNPTLWSYGLLHGDAAAIRVWLEHHAGFVAELGGRIRTGLVSIDPVERRTYEHLEYWPLVNARTFTLGARRQIVNDRFHAQYHRFLDDVSRGRGLSNDDRLAAVVYLLLQDRVDEARAHFDKVLRDGLATRLQYDYADAVLALHAGDPQRARAVALQHVNFPVDRWRQRFELVVAHADEAAGKGDAAVLDPLDRSQELGALAAQAPALEMRLEGATVVLDHRNLARATVALHEMDLEVLFSRNPFAGSFAGQFGSVRPNRTIEVELDASGTTRVPLPPESARRNLLVTVTSGGIARSEPAYSTGLAVRVVENYGQVLVTRSADGKPVAKAYVKVYARMDDGGVAFYKDGFTDVRGRFDYASLSTDDAVRARRFSILVTSPEEGSAVREAAPPPR